MLLPACDELLAGVVVVVRLVGQHPDGAPGDGRTEPGPDVVFYAAVPSDGGYHLYLDFKHDGVVRTATFSLATVDAANKAASPAPETNTGDGGKPQNSKHGH